MKVGLLLCSEVPADLLHFGGDHGNMFSALFPEMQFVRFPVHKGVFPGSADDCDAYVCTGSPSSVYDDDEWIHRLKSFVVGLRDAGKPYLGVCFGHQMLAEALGGRVLRNPGGVCTGVHTFEVVKREEWMTPYRPLLNILMVCGDQVASLPPGGVVLAKSTDCPVAIYRVGMKMIGIQGHPEYPLEYASALGSKCFPQPESGFSPTGMRGFDSPVDGKLCGAWLLNFLQLAFADSR